MNRLRHHHVILFACALLRPVNVTAWRISLPTRGPALDRKGSGPWTTAIEGRSEEQKCKAPQTLHGSHSRWRGTVGMYTSESSGGVKQELGQLKPVGQGRVRRVYETWTWRGHKINYRVEGPEDGPPLLLIHGFGASVGHWRHQFRELPAQGYRVHAVDLLGFGASDKPRDVEVYELELWRDLLLDYMEHMENEVKSRGDWTIMGNSIGGLLSLMVAKARPSAAAGVVLFNSAGGLTSFRDEELPWYLRPLWTFIRTVMFGDMFGPGMFERFRTEDNVRSVLRQVYGEPSAVDDDLVDILLTPGQDDGAQEVFLKVLRGPAGPSPESCLPDIKCPVIAIWGKDDPWTPVDKGLHPGINFHKYNPGLKLHIMPRTGHCPQDERPDECHQILLPFLQQVYTPADNQLVADGQGVDGATESITASASGSGSGGVEGTIIIDSVTGDGTVTPTVVA